MRLTVVGFNPVGWLLALTLCSRSGCGWCSFRDPDLLTGSFQARLRHKLYQALPSPAAKMAQRPVDIISPRTPLIDTRPCFDRRFPAYHIVERLDTDFVQNDNVGVKGLTCWPGRVRGAINFQQGSRSAQPSDTTHAQRLSQGICFGMTSLIETKNFEPTWPSHTETFDSLRRPALAAIPSRLQMAAYTGRSALR